NRKPCSRSAWRASTRAWRARKTAPPRRWPCSTRRQRSWRRGASGRRELRRFQKAAVGVVSRSTRGSEVSEPTVSAGLLKLLVESLRIDEAKTVEGCAHFGEMIVQHQVLLGKKGQHDPRP